MDGELIGLFREKVRRAQRELGWSLKNDIRCCGVTMAQCQALMEIGGCNEVSIVELAAALRVDTSTLSRTIDTMVKNGLVNRLLNPEDRRYVRLTLTEEGYAVFRMAEDSFDAYVERVFRFIPPERHEQVMDSLLLLASALEECGKTCQCRGAAEGNGGGGE